MTVTAITFTIIGLILASIAAIYFVQSREKARINKIRQINSLQDGYRRMQKLLNELPPQYLSRDLRILVLQRSIETLKLLVSQDSNPAINKNLETDQDLLKQLQDQNYKLKPVAVRDENHAKEIRLLLEILFRFVESQQKRGRLSGAAAKKHLLDIKYLIEKSKADNSVTLARRLEGQGKFRLAIHNYHNAISVLKAHISHSPQAAEEVAALKAKIKALEKAAEDEKQSASASEKSSETSDEWDSFLKPDDTWKKKNTYDDK
jgi:hypothetical protein